MSNWKDLHDTLEIETIRKSLKKLTGEYRSLEDFTCQALQLLGNYIDASSLTVSIQDCEQDCGVIDTRLSKQNNIWQFDLGDAGTFNKGPAVIYSQTDDFSQHPLHSFSLDLPHKWQGVLEVEYPVTVRTSSEHHRALKNILTDLSYGLHITLLNQRQLNLEDSLRQKARTTRKPGILSKKQGGKIKTLKHLGKIQSHATPEKENREKPVIGYLPHQPKSSPGENQSFFTKLILTEIEHSRNMALLGELASGVAHQIRNPLNNLLGALHLIKDDETPEEERRNLFDQLTERVEIINRMISEFIYYTRITELNRTSENINTVLENSLHSFKSLIEQYNVELITSYERKLPAISLDLYLMNQVFHNIIKNAMEA
jgi:C4-dicarboxylate-specific signal transduction histidine kinase